MSNYTIFKFGINTFNNNKMMFKGWLYRKNYSLGEVTPISLLCTEEGKKQVMSCLNRIEYGNMA